MIPLCVCDGGERLLRSNKNLTEGFMLAAKNQSLSPQNKTATAAASRLKEAQCEAAQLISERTVETYTGEAGEAMWTEACRMGALSGLTEASV